MNKLFNHPSNSKYEFDQLHSRRKYPSITSILSVQSNEGLEKWRAAVGDDIADWEMRRASIRGKAFHSIAESYLKNQDISHFEPKILPMGLFNLVKEQIDRIDNICALEANLFSNSYKIAGRVDICADFDGVKSIIDLKSANKAKNEDQLNIHAIQETAYAVMWEEMTNESIEQIVTIVACENGEYQTIINKPSNFLNDLKTCIKDFEWVLVHGKKRGQLLYQNGT